MIMFHGDAKKEWEQCILNGEDIDNLFIETRYIVDTKNGTIEITNPIWTNVRATFEDCVKDKTYIARFVLNEKEVIDIYTENIIYIRKLEMGKYYYDSLSNTIEYIPTN